MNMPLHGRTKCSCTFFLNPNRALHSSCRPMGDLGLRMVLGSCEKQWAFVSAQPDSSSAGPNPRLSPRWAYRKEQATVCAGSALPTKLLLSYLPLSPYTDSLLRYWSFFWWVLPLTDKRECKPKKQIRHVNPGKTKPCIFQAFRCSSLAMISMSLSYM